MFTLNTFDETIHNENLSPEFNQKITELKPTVLSMVENLANFKKQRMIVIGELQAFRNQTGNAEDKKAIRNLLGKFTADVVDSCVASYKAYKALEAHSEPEYKDLAEQASPTQLKIIGRGSDTSVAYDAAMALKRTGKVPTTQELNNIVMGRQNLPVTENRFKTEKPEIKNPVPQPEAQPLIDRNQKARDLSNEDNCLSFGGASVFVNHSRYNILEAALHILQTTEMMSPQTQAVVDQISMAIKGETVEVKAEPVVHHNISSYFSEDGKVLPRVR